MKDTVRILIADDHAVVRMGIAALLSTEDDLEVVGEASNGEEAVRETLRLKPALVVMDLMMPKLDGAAATREILGKAPSTKVAILTSFATSDALARAVAAGATGVILKNTLNEKLIATLRKVAGGGRSIPPDVQRNLAECPPAPDLTVRQFEVLTALARGLSNREIALALGLSGKRVEEHVAALCEKLSAANRTEAISLAYRKHLLKT